MRHLAAAWLDLAARSGARGDRGDLAGAGAALLGRWSEPHRGYHDLTHLTEVLERIDLLAEEAGSADVVRLAAWFHDAVYDPRAGDNEERSASLALETLARLGVPAAGAQEVARLVRVTTTHDVRPGDTDAAVLCDADLAVLASSGGRYRTYLQGIRSEYGHLTDATFAQGRAAVLQRLLDRERLFGTAYGQRVWEVPARAQITAELYRLRGDGGGEVPRPAAG